MSWPRSTLFCCRNERSWLAVALPFFALVRKVLRPVLAVDPAVRARRRADPIESGPLGLRGLEVRR